MTHYNKGKASKAPLKAGESVTTLWGKEETAISVPTNFEELSPEAQKLYIYKKEQEARKGREFDKTFSHPRLLSEQQTKPVQLDFWTSTQLAKSKMLQQAKILQTDGKLLNTFSLGIDGDVLTLKVIQTLQEMVYETSELYGKDGKVLSASNTLLPSANVSPREYFNIPKGTKYPAITTTSYNFTKEVQGGRKPNTSEITKVLNELERLRTGSYLLQDSKTHRGALMSLLDVTYLVEGNKDILYIELKPIFAKVVGQNYVRERKDVARYLRRKVRKAMTLLLYELLMTAFSRGLTGENKPYMRYKDELFARIAKSASYKNHPKRVAQDFKASLEVMKKIKLLQEYKENDFGSVCYFTLNKNFLKDDIKLE